MITITHMSERPNELPRPPETLETRREFAISGLIQTLFLSEQSHGGMVFLFERNPSAATRFLEDVKQRAQTEGLELEMRYMADPPTEGDELHVKWVQELDKLLDPKIVPGNIPEGSARIFIFDLTQLTHIQQFNAFSFFNTRRTELLSNNAFALILSTADTFNLPLPNIPQARISGSRDFLSCVSTHFLDQ